MFQCIPFQIKKNMLDNLITCFVMGIKNIGQSKEIKDMTKYGWGFRGDSQVGWGWFLFIFRHLNNISTFEAMIGV